MENTKCISNVYPVPGIHFLSFPFYIYDIGLHIYDVDGSSVLNELFEVAFQSSAGGADVAPWTVYQNILNFLESFALIRLNS
jgi:hypothetical protein